MLSYATRRECEWPNARQPPVSGPANTFHAQVLVRHSSVYKIKSLCAMTVRYVEELKELLLLVSLYFAKLVLSPL